MDVIVEKVGDNHLVWDLYAYYWREMGNYEEAVKNRNRQCRVLQVAGWEQDKEKFNKLVDASSQLGNDTILFNNQKILYSTRLFLTSIMKKSMDSFEGTEHHNKLIQVIENIKSAESELKKQQQ
eukprot:TRINITY_DN286_c1_g1_i4.p1 TRINITY_DN286_c1_g1~~TRINITY_DN286_c1_g1_i4.p1  ORF type:complete len:124 (-),score=24.75 TRINITY_DN286_c1_g1_i4:43-414(-)